MDLPTTVHVLKGTLESRVRFHHALELMALIQQFVVEMELVSKMTTVIVKRDSQELPVITFNALVSSQIHLGHALLSVDASQQTHVTVKHPILETYAKTSIVLEW